MQRRIADRFTIALAVAGLLISGYLTLLHYDSRVPLVCSAGSYVNCETVLTSPSAIAVGVPVAVWGMVWFAVALALAALDFRGGTPGGGTLRNAGVAWSALGVAGVMYLVYQEIGVIGKLCAWCTAVHVIIVSMLIVQSLAWSGPEPSRAPDARRR